MICRRHFRYCATIALLAIGLAASAFAKQEASIPPAQNPQPVTAQVAAPAIPSYPDTAKGLEKFMKDMMKCVKDGDKQALANYARSLVLPDAESWFKSVFGDALGTQLATISERSRNEIELSAPDMLAQFEHEKRTNIDVVRLDESCGTLALPVESPFLALRQRPEPLYDIRFSGHGDSSVWLYFAYVNGGFRYIGTMRRKGLEGRVNGAGIAGSNPAGPQALHVPLNVQQARLVSEKMPVYPDEAKRAHIQGTVVLRAIIAKDGTVRDLDVIEGQCALTESAITAVRSWRYKPTIINGEPVEVDTTINVVFTLGG